MHNNTTIETMGTSRLEIVGGQTKTWGRSIEQLINELSHVDEYKLHD